MEKERILDALPEGILLSPAGSFRITFVLFIIKLKTGYNPRALLPSSSHHYLNIKQ
ncbi:hypothetical protein M3210_05870 [Oceanobacillus luteolus]|uniref:Uncharacterized protein n=1 Tax=Oceanobacillus luteolus TaxID=1274358 RepID=A0ABW4HWI3_9BACI|nr:hypothetical protein [Oceanobacillus luteolus]MCM3739794.1 hypothetical protein [Oceanobacillus luteolus]